MSKSKFNNDKNRKSVQMAVRSRWQWEGSNLKGKVRADKEDNRNRKVRHLVSKFGYHKPYGARRRDKEERLDVRNSTAKLNNKRYFFEMDMGTKLEGIRNDLFRDRYSMKDEMGQPKEIFPEQMWRRVSKALAQVEKTTDLKKKWEKEFYSSMEGFRFCPAGRFLTSAGTGTKTTMINCFVIPNPEDTREGIINTLKQVTEISARGGGVGFNLSTLRPRGSYLKSVNGTSSGAVSWANIYSVAAHDIIQQGGTRRGALMLMLWDWHPDIEEFITVKKDQQKILGANLSVCVSNAFMEAVKNDEDWELKFPDTESDKYRTDWHGDLQDWMVKGYPVKVYKTLKAKYLWNLICESAWASAEPGTVFMDRYNEMNNTWYFEKNIATNPCGEQGLPAWGVCNLSSINLSALVDEDGNFDWDDYERLIRIGVRFLDNAVDSEIYLYKEIEDVQLRERRIGLGTLGLADALIKMKIRYGSEESLELIDRIYRKLRDVAYETSVDLAKEKGVFPAFDADKYLKSGFMRSMPKNLRKKIRKFGIRNALLLTEAPTGKIALLAGASSGIEPVFSFSYLQKDRLGERMVYHPLYKKWIDGNLKGAEIDEMSLDEKIPDFFVVADDLSPEEHVKIQALIQKYTDSSISKTVNAPEGHTVEDVKRLYELAFEMGCKGISYMREGSREGTLIRNKKSEKDIEANEEIKNGVSEKHLVWMRPIKINGSTYKLETPMGRAFITVNHDADGSPVEVFINIGRAGSDIQAMAEAIGRLISKSLKMGNGLSVKDKAMVIVDQLSGISGGRSVGFGSKKIASLPDAVAKAMAMDMGLIGYSEYAKTQGEELNDKLQLVSSTETEFDRKEIQLSIEGTKVEPKPRVLGLIKNNGDICPECGNATLIHEMGCKTCHGCGYSEC